MVSVHREIFSGNWLSFVNTIKNFRVTHSANEFFSA